MTNSHHVEMASTLLDRMLFSERSAASLARARLRLRSENLDANYVASLGQTQFGPSSWPPEQAAAYLRLHTGLMRGEFGRVGIDVSHSPDSDANREQNASRLGELPHPFRATVDVEQNFADCDGRLQWVKPIRIERSVGAAYYDHGLPSPILLAQEIVGSAVPLEIGVSHPSRTLLHLLQEGGVARWPYGSSTVTLLINVRKLPLPAGEGAA
ncbi:hypothetical protein [Streptomyces sp. NPDC060188]|uniref:hypothetical protein n=1 Tax=Streptomyces sp. NPDC060188 TaxID=3347068 RepID=UPI00365554FE